MGSPSFIFERGSITVYSPSRKNSATIKLHGAHVTSFKVGEHELFYMSQHMNAALFDEFNKNPANRTAIRGGIPLIFPQFGPGKYQNHGFARNVEWTFVDGLKASNKNDATTADVPPNSNSIILELKDNEYTRSVWPFAFAATFVVSIDDEGKLTTALSVTNTSEDTISFQTAFHTYFRVNNIDDVKVANLKGLQYIDKVRNAEKFEEDRAEVTIATETDRVYLQAPGTIVLKETGASHDINIHKSDSLPDAVVWNPWVEKTKAVKDMEDEDYKVMICIETGAIGSPVQLKQNESWTGKQSIEFKPAAVVSVSASL